MHGRVIEIDCDIPARALEVLRQVEGLDQVALYGSLIHVVADDLAKHESVIRRALQDAGLVVKSLTVIPPSLEDVFIARAKS